MRNKFSRHFSIPIIAAMLTLPILLPGPPAQAQDCIASACISVFIEDGQIVIEGRKDSAAPVARKKPLVTRSPRPAEISSPQPQASPRATRRVVLPKKRVVKVVRKVVAAVSLNDRLIKLLPTANISKQPASGVVVGVPVIFWCDLPSVFHSKVTIIGEVIDVTMRPAFFWSFGDGSMKLTTQSGAPFPSEDISRRYSRAGQYPVVLVAIWGGTWVHNGMARVITGTIRKVSFAFVKVSPAPTLVKR